MSSFFFHLFFTFQSLAAYVTRSVFSEKMRFFPQIIFIPSVFHFFFASKSWANERQTEASTTKSFSRFPKEKNTRGDFNQRPLASVSATALSSCHSFGRRSRYDRTGAIKATNERNKPAPGLYFFSSTTDISSRREAVFREKGDNEKRSLFEDIPRVPRGARFSGRRFRFSPSAGQSDRNQVGRTLGAAIVPGFSEPRRDRVHPAAAYRRPAAK